MSGTFRRLALGVGGAVVETRWDVAGGTPAVRVLDVAGGTPAVLGVGGAGGTPAVLVDLWLCLGYDSGGVST